MQLQDTNVWLIISLLMTTIVGPIVVWRFQQGRIERLKLRLEEEKLQIDKNNQVVEMFEKLSKLLAEQRQLYDSFTALVQKGHTVGSFDFQQKLQQMDEKDQDKVVNFFEKNKILIVSDLLKGRGEFSADWVLVILKGKKESRWVLKSINEAMNIFGSGDIRITSQGSLKIGRIGMQRKGGDNGRDTAKMLQFKVNPVELFDR